MVLQVGLGARDKEGLRQMHAIKPGEIDVTPIHHVKAAGFEGNQVENLDIAQFAVRDVDEGRDVAAQIEQGVQFDGALVLAKARPGKQCQTKIDSGRVEGINRLFQFQTEVVAGIQLSGCLDQTQGEIPIDAPVACLVGIGQGTFGNAAANSQVVKLRRMRTQTGFDVAKALPVGQLGKGHAQKLIQVRKRQRRILSRIPFHASPKGLQRKAIH